MMMKRWFLLLLVACSLQGCAESAFAQNTQPQNSFSSQVLAANPSLYLTFNNPAQLFRENQSGVSFIAGGAGTILSGQTGFDNKEPNNTAASFPYNSYIYAPNFTLGDYDWNTPFMFMYQIDRLNWVRSGTKVLLSKGNVLSNSTPWYELYITMKTSTVAQFCFKFNGVGAPSAVQGLVCTNAAVDYPNGYNYNLFVANTGTGAPTAFSLWVNGTGTSITSYNGSGYGFGSETVAVGGTGTGYAATTPIHSVGGGTGCVVEATLNASGGVPTTVSLTQALNYGCTSNPTFAVGPYMASIAGSGTGYASSTAFTSTGGGTGCAVTGTMTSSGGVPVSVTTTPTAALQLCTSAPTLTFTSPTGTGETITAVAPGGSGVTLTASASGNSMSSATKGPLYILGSWQASAASSWVASASVSSDTNASDPPMLVDEFADFSAATSGALIYSIFYQTKFYQGLLKTIPATPYKLVFDNDGCTDPDNLYALVATIAAQRLGYITLAGVVDTDGSGQSMAMYRQLLDQAGLAHIPLSVPSVSALTSTGICTAANINAYNSATPQTASGYMSAATMYRTILAANPTTPVFIMLGGSFRGVADLMQSAADGISSLTGAQLVAQNAANGGAIYAQGLGANIAFTGDNSLEDWTAGQYVVSHNGSLPIYWYGGQPQASGPGVLSTRNAKDPMYLFATTYGSDSRQAFDSLPTASFISNAFSGGVTVAIGGSGTGYAASTPFTSTGGGANCVVTGYMLATGGVPSSIQYLNGGTYPGIGSGCTNASSPPTIVLTAPTGTGVTLTATTTASVCGTVTITASNAGSTTTATCSNHYFLPYSVYADGSNAAFLTWFLNSLIDPPPNGAPRVQ
jgi:hypothetical protein